MSAELSRYLCAFIAFDRSRSQNVVVAHSVEDAIEATKLNANCREILEVKKIEEVGPKTVRQKSAWVSGMLLSNPELNSQIGELADQLAKLHK